MPSLKYIFATLLVLGLVLLSQPELAAQCAMCRVSVENNINNGTPTLGSGLNLGILYLLIMPYLIIGSIGYYWYKVKSKKGKKELRVAR